MLAVTIMVVAKMVMMAMTIAMIRGDEGECDSDVMAAMVMIVLD
jgi:hypothetical protein